MEIAACKLPAHWVARSKEGHVVMEVVLPDLGKDGILKRKYVLGGNAYFKTSRGGAED